MPKFERGNRHLCRLLRKAGDPQRDGAVSVGANAGIVTSIVVSVSVMSLGVIQRDATLGVSKRNRIEAQSRGNSPSASDKPRA